MNQYSKYVPPEDREIREAVKSPLYKEHIKYSGSTVSVQMLMEFSKL